MGMDISFEKLRIVLGRKNMSRKSIPQVNRGREESSHIFNEIYYSVAKKNVFVTTFIRFVPRNIHFVPLLNIGFSTI